MSIEILTNPLTGERARVIESTKDVFKMEIFLPPNGVPAGEHIHPYQEQITYVKRGSLHCSINGVKSVIQASDYVRIKAGVPHALWNPTATEVCIIEAIEPAGRVHDFFRALFSLLHETARAKKSPGLLIMVALFSEFRDSARPARVSHQTIFRLFAPLAKLLGYQKVIRKLSKQL